LQKRKIQKARWLACACPRRSKHACCNRHRTPERFTPRDARRAQIRAAAGECFRQHGFHGTSIAQISKRAGMSTGHIYHYFENKEAIIATSSPKIWNTC